MKTTSTLLLLPKSKAFSWPSIIFLLLLSFHSLSYGQSISTYPTWTTNNGTGFVTFNIQNTNTFPITITEVGGPVNAIALSTAQFWLAPSAISSAPPTIGNLAANGWTAIATQTFTPTIGNGSTPEPILTGLSIVVPASSTIGVGISVFASGCTTGRLRYYSIPASNPTPVLFSNSGVNLISGAGIGYAATSCTQTPINSRGFVGYINFNAVPTANCSTVSFPATAHISATVTAICNSGSTTLNMTTPTNMPAASGITYQFQSSNSANGPWINAGAAQLTPSYSPSVTAPTYFRCQVLCNATTAVLTSDTTFVDVLTPQIVNTKDSTKCGPGTLSLSATSSPGTTIYWFATNNPTNPLGSGPTFVTPNLISTTTYYAGAFLGTPQTTPICGSALVPVIATIKDHPIVDLGNDINKCIDEGQREFLNARNPGLNYLWNDGYNGQVKVVDRSGIYWVYVENELGCGTTDTIKVTFKKNPKSKLGEDTTVCIKTSILLDAGNDGVQYIWNTGSTANAITTNTPGQYIVRIAGANGCVKTDSINVTHQGNAPQHDGIYVKYINDYTFKFSLFNARHIESVAWDFGDGSPISYAHEPQHTYTVKGNYVVRAITYSSCGSAKDTTTVHILSTTHIKNNNIEDAIQIYPNPSSTSELVTVKSKFSIRKITIYAANGFAVQTIDHLNTPIYQLNTKQFSSELYILIVETDEGIGSKKLEILSQTK